MIYPVVSHAMWSAVVRMIIASAIVARIVVVLAVMSATIAAIVMGATKVVMIVVGIGDVHTEIPIITTCIDGAIEILRSYKTTVLRVAQYVT